MQLTNTDKGYGWASILLHWLAAIGVLTMLAIGLRADALEEAHDHAGHIAFMGWHISIGASLLVIALLRVFAHYAQRQPDPPAQPPPLRIIARATHHLLLLAILILFVSGPLTVWSGGRPIRIWDAIALPSPFAARNEGVHEFAENLHAVGRYMLYVLVPLHVAGALKHLLIDRDTVFKRMLVPQR